MSKRYIPILFLLWLPLLGAEAPPAAPSKIPVVTTIPVLQEFVEAVGKDRVEARSLITGLENEHTYTPKPSDIAAVREARILVRVGLGLEVWVDGLVRNAQNNQLLIVTTSQGIAILRDPGSGRPRGGSRPDDEHHLGNPHIWMDPENAKTMVRHITEALIRVNPGSKRYFLMNQAEYIGRIDQVQRVIAEKVRGLPDRRIITHHPAWPYFARRFGFVVADTIISQPGMEPSGRRLAELIRQIRQEKIQVIVSEPQYNDRIPRMLAQETGARLVKLSVMPGTMPGMDSYLDMLEYTADTLIRAIRGQP